MDINEMDSASIGLRIREIRKERKMTQTTLAKESGISRTFLCDLEYGRYNPSVETIIAIAKVLDVDISEFLQNDAYEVRMIQRAAKSMTDEQRTKMYAVIKTLYGELFDEVEDNKKITKSKTNKERR